MDAMALAPYMCAADDIQREQMNDGLRRDGSITLGAHHCDFRYKQGGFAKPLAEQYPQRIKLLQQD